MKEYITLSGKGTNFRKMSRICTKKNFTMNHATARNILYVALRKLLEDVAEQFQIELTNEKVEMILKNQQFHNALSDILPEIYKELNIPLGK